MTGALALIGLVLIAFGWASQQALGQLTPFALGQSMVGLAALAAAGLSLDQMDICEVNEAFAPQFLAVKKELGLDNDKTNVCGGAIAIGHP